MNPSTIVYGMKWNWTVSFAMWSTTRSALVWQRIHAPGLGRAHGWGWQAKAPAPRYLPHNSCRLLHSCRLGLPTSVKYDPHNPGNSLVVSESWMGLRQ